jgi:hypothetical protein
MDAVVKMKDPVTDTYRQGHQSICAIVVGGGQVIPWGLRLYVKPQDAKALHLPFQKTTELAAHLIREFKCPGGVQVIVLFDADDLCHTVVQACRAQGCRLASTLTGHRRLFKPGWQLTAGRYGQKRFRRRRHMSLVLTKRHGRVRYRDVDVGRLQVSTLGPLPVVFSRNGCARKIFGLVTDAPELSAAGLIQTYENLWAVERFFKDSQPRLGLGHYQHRSSGAAVTPRHLVGFASALLTHLRLAHHGAPGQSIRNQAANWSTAAVQDHLRSLIWDDSVNDLQEKHPHESVLMELERLRAGEGMQKSVNLK